MLEQVLKILKNLYAQQVLLGKISTVGELSKECKIPYSTTKRRLIMAEKSGLVEWELVDYKSTGKRVFWLTEKGLDWVSNCKELL